MVPLARPNSLVSARAEGMRSPGFNKPAGNGATKPVIDLTIKRLGCRRIQWRKLAGVCDCHGLAVSADGRKVIMP